MRVGVGAAGPAAGVAAGARAHPWRTARGLRSATPWRVGLLCAALVVAGFGLGFYRANLHNGLIAATFTAVGVFVVGRRPGHREGWLFIAVGSAHSVMFFGRQYGFFSATRQDALPGAAWVTWLAVWPLALVLVLVAVVLMCFPDGRLPSPRWRTAVAVMVSVGALVALLSALWPVEYADNSLPTPHPLHLGGYETAQRLWDLLGPASYLTFQLVWAVCVVARMRRARGDGARQLKWFAYAVAVGAVAMLVSVAVFRSPALGVLVVPVVPLAAGLAIVKYRLYDIDLVINKTLVVGAMAVIITAGYAAVVVGAGGLVGGMSGADPLLSLVATAIVAIAFEPVRRRVQGVADRLVYGRRPSPYEALARLSGQLSVGGPDADLFSGLASTIAHAVGAEEVTVWAGPRDHLLAMASWPPRTGQATHSRDLASLEGERVHVRAIVHQGALRGAVTVTKPPGEALGSTEDRLLHDLVAQAGLVIDNIGLEAELRRRLDQISVQAAELQAAAKRIVAAQYEARRRIERDLHDGAQQQLVTLALSLQMVSGRATAIGDPALVARIDQARDQLSQALGELREMARGIHPAILTQEGLEAAVGFLAERSPLPVQADVRLDRRLAPDVEATAYFVVSEALTNAAKHSGASAVEVTGRIRDDRLQIEVIDNGRGGADEHRGSGLQGLADRLATLDGHLTVDSPAGGGTRLGVEIPCA